nr:hypothetical transcript [Hymenolepis microstoma]
MFGQFPSTSERSSWVQNTIEQDHLPKFSCVIDEDIENRAAFNSSLCCVSVLIVSSGGMGVEVSKYWSFVLDIKKIEVGYILGNREFSGFESSCLEKSLQHSTEGSAEVVVRPDKEDFFY